MSFEHNFIDGYVCEFENDLEDEEVQAFPETISSDSYQSSDYLDFLMCHDALSLGQLDQGNQFFECQSDLPSNGCHQSIQTPTTSEDLPSSGAQTCFEDLCISYNQAENQQNFRATLEKFLYENEFPDSLSSSPSSFIELDRDPTELDRQLKNTDENSFELRLINVPAVVQQVPLELENQTVEKGQIEEDMHSPVGNSFEIPPLKGIVTFSQRKKNTKKNAGVSVKKPNSRQSQYKNIYSLVEEHSRRLLKDWIDLSWEEIEKVENGHKSVAAQIEEEMELKFDFEQFENNIQESDDLKKSRNLPIRQKFNEKLDSQIKKKRQKELAQKLHYKRFRLLSSLSRLVNNNPDAFISKTEFEGCLEKKPKTRTLACMKEFLKENIKFGLIVSRLSVELLPISMESQESNLLSNLLRKSALAFMYWKVKSPMQQKNRELLRREDTRAHIRGVLKDVYIELKEAAQCLLPAREVQMVEDCFNDSDELGNISEKQFGLDFELSRDVSSYINEHNQCFDGFLTDEEVLKKRTKRHQS